MHPPYIQTISDNVLTLGWRYQLSSLEGVLLAIELTAKHGISSPNKLGAQATRYRKYLHYIRMVSESEEEMTRRGISFRRRGLDEVKSQEGSGSK